MQVLLNIKVDPRMKAALKELAETQFISISATVKQAIEKHLKDQGIDWRQVEDIAPSPVPVRERETDTKAAQEPESFFYSVEIPSGDNLIHQFNIQEVAGDGTCSILIKEGSPLLDELRAGDNLNLKFYSLNALRPVEIKNTEVVGISKTLEGRFKGHFVVALRVGTRGPE